MSALRTALLEWDADRIVTVVTAGVAVYSSTQLTDGLVTGLALAICLAAVLGGSWWGVTRLVEHVWRQQ
ncbi:hypothetical protein [Natrialba sp. SSL1]|uniref:hypothetical protein n=1 Tax=Natrialba sp. SSL1 TaxID=1869245 RepID=UPI0008F977D2|nr:hypothetical protein [Natrialba sp. SSL1]OIB57213.1 hypothetical protein BBD46_15905 [Natrialba sp. SSL1]